MEVAGSTHQYAGNNLQDSMASQPKDTVLHSLRSEKFRSEHSLIISLIYKHFYFKNYDPCIYNHFNVETNQNQGSWTVLY
jgi:hypothetical protein